MVPQFVTSDISADWRKLEQRPLALELRFSYRSENMNYVGSGRTRTMGGDTLCFETDQWVAPKGEVELYIAWPYRLQDVCELELIVKGQLIGTDGSLAYLRMESCEFQTLGARSFAESSSLGLTCDLAA